MPVDASLSDSYTSNGSSSTRPTSSFDDSRELAITQINNIKKSISKTAEFHLDLSVDEKSNHWYN